LSLSPHQSKLKAGSVPLRSFVEPAVCFGVLAGLIEGAGLLLFQRINWPRWGATIHVSEPILWISILVDVLFFLILGMVGWGIGRLFPRAVVLRGFLSVLVFLSIYDWLTVTGRLKVVSCVLLAIGIAAVLSRWMNTHNDEVKRFWRRTAPWAAAIGLGAFGIIAGGQRWMEKAALQRLPAASPDTPNVLIIVVDTLRADHLSAYGYLRPTSPNIDRIASQGILFENAVSAGSWSLPSHASILTGRYQFEHGVGDVDGTPIRDSRVPAMGGFETLGEALEKLGYRTAAFSANRSYFSENLGFGRGFMHFEDYFHSTSDCFVRTLYGGELAGFYLTAKRNSVVARIFHAVHGDAWMDASFEGAGGLNGAHVRKRATTVNEEVLHWVDGNSEKHPFFAVLNYFDVHNPYGGPPGYPKPAWEQGSAVDQYDDSVKYVDDAVGYLMSGLSKRGLDKKTLVIVTSDHGESLGQHGLAYHGHSLYRELIHVPLMFWYPERLPAGRRVSQPVTNAAIPATVMEILGDQSHPFPRQGLDAFWRTPAGGLEAVPELSELSEEHFLEPEDEGADKVIPLGTKGAMKSVIGEQWHLIIHKRYGNQLYDLARDPKEAKNLIHTPEGERVSSQLMGEMENILAGRGEKQLAVPLRLNMASGPEASMVQMEASTAPGDDYYRFKAEPGTVLTVDVSPQRGAKAIPMDSVVTVTDGDGRPLETCRDPEDDHAAIPGSADPTPDNFDDVCINDDISPGVQTDSQLEILVPGEGHSPVELFIRVSEWNGRTGPGLKYQIAVRGSGVNPAVKTAKR
jgi:arylsulfatase A-like enzyme